MLSVASMLRSLASAQQCAVVYTNHSVSAGTSDDGPSSKPALGVRWISTRKSRISETLLLSTLACYSCSLCDGLNTSIAVHARSSSAGVFDAR